MSGFILRQTNRHARVLFLRSNGGIKAMGLRGLMVPSQITVSRIPRLIEAIGYALELLVVHLSPFLVALRESVFSSTNTTRFLTYHSIRQRQKLADPAATVLSK